MPALHVIVAEDDPDMRRWIRHVLGRQDVSVHEAASGSELLLLLTVLPRVDLIISDVRMPMLDGLQVLAMVRAVGMDLPFLLITGYGDRGLRNFAGELNASVLDKPFSARQLVATVSSLVSLENGPSGSNGSAQPAAAAIAFTGVPNLVRDQGVGIRPEHVAHVFEPFFTAVSEEFGLNRSWDRFTNHVREKRPSEAERVYRPAPLILGTSRAAPWWSLPGGHRVPSLGMSDRLVGLTIVAVGTSLPELVTSVIAARRGHSDLAVGNVVGSNIFNTFLCLGAASLAGSVAAPLSTLGVDLVALGVITALAATFIRTERTISRLEGAMVAALYAAFAAITVVRG